METKKLGTIEINPRALAVIANIAAKEVDGVSKLLGKRVYSKGVELQFSDDELVIDVFCAFKGGVSITKTAKKVQEHIRNSIYNMTEINTKSININVLEIDF